MSRSSDNRTVFSVSELTREIKLNLETSFNNLWVVGELSNVSRPPSGHLYFTLKDQNAQLPAVMFRSATRHLRFQPGDGLAVLVWGHLTVYEPRGAYQIRVERMEPRGKGALQIAFEQLKEKLAKEGLFDAARKRALPLLPRRIGIVTSPTGAAIRDICRVLHRRFPNLEVLVYPAQVQGDIAAAEISQGIRVLNRLGGFDALIVARGGGSFEDLWSFNEESVARAIASSDIPVVSAVGHEIDFTISDFVADVRAPTPSAAAEMVVERKVHLVERVSRLQGGLDRAIAGRMAELRARTNRIVSHRAFAAALHAFEMKAQKLDEVVYRGRAILDRRLSGLERQLAILARRLEAKRLDRQIAEARAGLERRVARLGSAGARMLQRTGRSIAELVAKLETLSPLAVLGRGYGLVWSAQGKLLRDAAEVTLGEALQIDLHRGSLGCRVENIRPQAEKETDDE
ncbi:MAG TPA: exodeoxyribonuclease VII large subunit [Vicinamibacteria bacterium]|nr:exodeoxyribonuclease VII large subunit [Vicinamibacteria bacterium]